MKGAFNEAPIPTNANRMALSPTTAPSPSVLRDGHRRFTYVSTANAAKRSNPADAITQKPSMALMLRRVCDTVVNPLVSTPERVTTRPTVFRSGYRVRSEKLLLSNLLRCPYDLPVGFQRAVLPCSMRAPMMSDRVFTGRCMYVPVVIRSVGLTAGAGHVFIYGPVRSTTAPSRISTPSWTRYCAANAASSRTTRPAAINLTLRRTQPRGFLAPGPGRIGNPPPGHVST